MKQNELNASEYAAYFQSYINQVSNEYTLIEELEISVHRLIKFVQNIPMDKFDYRYAEGKWTIKDILQHLIDAERIFSYRALCFARKYRIQGRLSCKTLKGKSISPMTSYCFPTRF